MTVDELFEAIKPFKWRLHEGGAIRCGDDNECPLLVAWKTRSPRTTYTNRDYADIGDALGLPKHEALGIVNASDAFVQTEEERALRKRLMELV
jgi:hypothetical protein